MNHDPRPHDGAPAPQFWMAPPPTPADVASRILDAANATRRPTVIDAYNDAPLRSAFSFLSSCIVPNARILDLGCGAGHFTRALALQGARLWGIDAHQQSLDEARTFKRRHNIEYTHGNAENLPYDDAFFDAALSVSVLQYTDWRKVIRSCHRVLKPSGRACFVENLAGSPLAKGYRIARKHFWPYEQHLTPRQHLRWAERTEFERVFRSVHYSAYNITTPILLLPFALRDPRPASFSSAAQSCFQRLQSLDATLLRTCPPLSRSAWIVVIHCQK